MIGEYTLSRMAAIIGGKLIGSDSDFSEVCTDTRQLTSGALFVALSGPNFDGNAFVAAAQERGAVGALVAKQQPCDLPQVVVSDVLQGLRALAAHVREAFDGPMFAVTGSSGKTTVKEMLASILAQSSSVFYTKGNLNNHIGVPLSLLQLNEAHRSAVLELGASAEGEILFNARLVQPDVAIITNAGEAHLAGFGSKEIIVRTKGEILTCLQPGQSAVLNFDDPAYGVWNSMVGEAHVISFSASGNAQADIYATNIELRDTESCCVFHVAGTHFDVRIPAPGIHNVANALAAAAAAWAKSVAAEEIAAGLDQFAGVGGRLQFRRIDALRLIDDSYNANPSSMCAALDVLAAQPGYRIAVLGDMAELGDESRRLHGLVGKKAADLNLERVLAQGEYAEDFIAPLSGRGEVFADKDALAERVHQLVESEADVVMLVKGSRSAHMEEVIHILENKIKVSQC